jgi:DNA uptake protein ComE-like DNA-binding protein
MPHHALPTPAVALLLAALLLAPGDRALARELQSFEGATYIDADFNDGDSFKLRFDGQEHVVRLYYVDAPETAAASTTDQRRLREQANYFGVPGAASLVEFGRAATALTRSLLKDQDFTVHTAFAKAPGRSALPRIYVMITLADGSDLGARLISEGLARSVGVNRARPDGTPSPEFRAQLDDLELAAALARRGAWSATDPEKIAELRANSRAEGLALKGEFDAFFALSEDNPLDLNSCSMEELQQFKGIGEALATRIVAARPFTSVDQLKDVSGIGPSLFAQMTPFLTVAD